MFSLTVCYVVSSYFGLENEISGYSRFDGRGNEFDQNHWMLILRIPVSDVYDVLPPAEERMTESPHVCQNTCISDSVEKAVKPPGCNNKNRAEC